MQSVYYSQIKLSSRGRLARTGLPRNLARTSLPLNRPFRGTGFPRNTLVCSLSPPPPPRIALSGSGKPPMYVQRTSLSLSIYIPASSGLGNTPSRTLLFHYVSFRTDPLLSTISTTDYSDVLLTDFYTLQRGRNTQ